MAASSSALMMPDVRAWWHAPSPMSSVAKRLSKLRLSVKSHKRFVGTLLETSMPERLAAGHARGLRGRCCIVVVRRRVTPVQPAWRGYGPTQASIQRSAGRACASPAAAQHASRLLRSAPMRRREPNRGVQDHDWMAVVRDVKNEVAEYVTQVIVGRGRSVARSGTA